MKRANNFNVVYTFSWKWWTIWLYWGRVSFLCFAMKDIITRIVVTLASIALLVYTGWLFAQGTVIVLPQRATWNTASYILVFGVGILLLILFGVYPVSFKRMKRSLTAAGIWLILLGFYVLKNDVASTLYLSDLIRVLGILLIILGPTGVIIPESIKKHQEREKTQIIEV